MQDPWLFEVDYGENKTIDTLRVYDKTETKQNKQSKARQSKAKQSKAKQSKAKQSKTKQNKPKQHRVKKVYLCIVLRVSKKFTNLNDKTETENGF